MPPDRIARLYDEFAPSLRRFLLSLTADETDTRDLLQDLFVRLARRGENASAIRDEQAYLFRSARNLATDLLRRRIRTRKCLAEFALGPPWLQGASSDAAGPEPEGAYAAIEEPDSDAAVAAFLQSRAAALLMELPEEQRAVVHLKIWENHTFARIADLLEIPANTAASRYRYAMEKLRAALNPARTPGP